MQDIDRKTQHDVISMTFYMTYVLLLTTGTITFIEALSTTNPAIRHIMNIETCISIVAGYFYSVFVDKVNKSEGHINFKELNDMRYNDWYITTPLMILVLMISLTYKNKSHSVHITSYLIAIILNFAMLFSGYLGDKGTISKKSACIIGFIFFILLFGFLYVNFVCDSGRLFNYILFAAYIFIWSIYGFAYLLDEKNKNIAYNILDLVAKCFVGLGLWAYFTKILVE